MTQGDCERIGRVIRFGERAQAEDDPHHFLHLVLVSRTVADNCLLHLHGSVFSDGYVVLGSSQQDHTTCLADRKRGCHVSRKKQLLDGNDSWMKSLNQFADSGVNVAQSERHRGIGWSFDHAVIDRHRFGVTSNHPVAERGRTRIDSERDRDGELVHWSVLADSCENIVRNVEVGIDLLHIIEVFEFLEQAYRLDRRIGIGRHLRFGFHDQLC